MFDQTTNPQPINSVATVVRTLRIIVCALVAGLLTFMAVYSFTGILAGKQNETIPLVVLVAFLFPAVTAAYLVPIIVDAKMRKQVYSQIKSSGKKDSVTVDKVGPLILQGMVTRTIIRCALLEGQGFFFIIVAGINKNPYLLAVPLILACLILINFPTTEGVETWVRTQVEKLREEESFE